VCNGWTGGQYSLYRTLFGLYLIGEFLASFSRDPLVIPIVILGSVCCAAFVVGWYDRRAAVLIFGAGVGLLALSSEAPDASQVFVGAGPSTSARGR
jgi:hypothetical protein